MLDAYAVRKAIPRIVLAVIGINLSIYLCLAAVDVTNILAHGMARLLVAPFSTSGMTVFDVPTDGASGVIGGVGLAVGANALVSALGGYWVALSATGGTLAFISGALSAMLWMLIPVAFLALAILVTVVIRQALLFFLIVVSPIAIACYILPGTEKYFQKWFDLFIKTLLVYPIIAIMFALSDVFASVILSTNSGGLAGVAKIITGIIVIYAPLFMIPFAFRFAGGAMGAIGKVAMGGADRMGKSGFVKARREYYGEKHKDNVLRGRAQSYRNAVADESTSSGIQRAFHGYRRKRMSGYRSDILDREAALNKKTAEAVNDTTNFGDDAMIRAYTVNKDFADAERAAGRGENELWRRGENGGIEYQSAGGSWQSEASVDESRRKYGTRNVSQWQQSMAYEMKKAVTQEQNDNLVKTFGETMDTWGASGDEANGSWIGAGFANQEKNRQWKHGRWGRDANGNFQMSHRADNLITEVDENIGSYQGSQANADTYTTMSQQVRESFTSMTHSQGEIRRLNNLGQLTPDQQDELASHQSNVANQNDVLHRASRIVNSLRSEVPILDDQGQPTGQTRSTIGAGASGRTQEEMRAFADITDAYAGKYTDQAGLPSATPTGTAWQRPAGDVRDALNDRSGDRRA